MIVFPNCKINLGLSITGKRPDGYHNLETIFYPIPFVDALEVIEDNSANNQQEQVKKANSLTFTATGIKIPGSGTDNLCVKAYRLLKAAFPILPPVKMHLHKTIPMGAGLGGGSSNGAATLQLLNQKFGLNLTNPQLIGYALQLGSDCPFFILNQPCFAAGRGELLDPVPINLNGYYLVIINPGIHISTREAFQNITPTTPVLDLKTISSLPVNSWKEILTNDFEAGVFKLHPVLATIKTSLYQSGALYASMTGTGSTIYGIFNHVPQLPAFDPAYLVKQLQL